RAGKLALNRSANAEAVRHLKRGVDVIQSQKASPQTSQRELEFCLALAPAMTATKGYASLETLNIFLRARDLLGDSATLSEQTTVLWGGFLAHIARAEYVASREVAQQCLTAATQHAHSGMLALGNRFMGQALLHMGAFIDARLHLQRALDLCAL